MAEYRVRLVTDPAEALPGAVRFGPVSDPERYRYGSSDAFWWEVSHLDGHREMLARYQQEAADSPPSMRVWRKRRAREHEAFIAALDACARLLGQERTGDGEGA